MKRILVVMLTLLASVSGWAQHRSQFSQYVFNQLVINPAYAGSKETLTLNAFHRTQWTGLEGAPNTQTFSIDGLTKNKMIGLGFHATRDEIFAQNRKNIEVDAAVKLPVSETGVLSFGLAAGISHFAVNGAKLITGNDLDDPAVISAQKETSWSPSLKAGVFFHTERFYAGLSVTDLLGIDKDINYDPERHYFFNVGYIADISPNVKVKPSIMLKENFDGPTNADFNLFFLFGERIWLGGGYRTAMNLFKNDFEAKGLSSKDAVVAIAELFVTKQLRLGYSHDFSLSRKLKDLRTHEMSVGYSFLNKEETKMVTPRYF